MTNILMSQVVLEEEVVESWFIDDPDMEIQVKTLNSKSDTSANYATTSANIINTLPQVQRLNKNILRQTLTKTEAKIKECF